MPTLQVKNVPERLHRRIQREAKRQGKTVGDLLLAAVERELARADFRARLVRREPVDLGRSAAEALEEVRDERDRELPG